MEGASIPQSATKTWVPLLVAGGPMLAAITGIQWFNLSNADALNVVVVVCLLTQLANSAVTWLTKNFVKQKVEIVTPGMAPNIPVLPGTPGWHAPVRWAAIAVGIGIVAMLAYWLL
mgnify:CR=1 FL=1